jgi:hypothetical protein
MRADSDRGREVEVESGEKRGERRREETKWWKQPEC